jgi:hypothetical protein
MVDRMTFERIIPPVSSSVRIKKASPDRGRKEKQEPDQQGGKRPKGQVEENGAKNDGKDSEGSTIDICV